MSEKLKKPSDYPQFYCRMKSEDKESIDLLLDEILLLAEKVDSKSMKKLKRNFVIQKALKIGLKSILRTYEKKSRKK